MVLTINAKTKTVTGHVRNVNPMAVNQFGDATYGYVRGHLPPNYPVPALYDVYADAEYLIMLYQYAATIRELAELRGETFN